MPPARKMCIRDSNQTARRLLNLSQPEPTLIGKRISSVISQEVFFYDAPQTNKKDEIVSRDWSSDVCSSDLTSQIGAR